MLHFKSWDITLYPNVIPSFQIGLAFDGDLYSLYTRNRTLRIDKLGRKTLSEAFLSLQKQLRKP